MTITLTLVDLGIFIACAAVLALVIYLIKLLSQATLLVKDLRKILDKHEHEIDRSLENVADILDNVNDITAAAADTVDLASEAVESVGSALATTTSNFSGKTEGISGYFLLAKTIIKLIRKFA